MEAIDLYLFLQERNIEMRWDDEVLSTWLSPYDIEAFCSLVRSSLEESGRETTLIASGYVWIDLVPICEYYGIEPERIFKR